MKIDIRDVTQQLDSKNKESYIKTLKTDTLPILILEDGVARTKIQSKYLTIQMQFIWEYHREMVTTLHKTYQNPTENG